MPDKIAETTMGQSLRSEAYDKRYYEEHCAAGLDYAVSGGWQEEYGRWFIESLGLRGKSGLDLGCACGAILRGLGKAGGVVCGCDLSEHMINIGRQRWPDMAPLLHVCDACNMHLWRDATFDFIHCAQVAEHWRPHLVPAILSECNRILKPGGIMFCCMDTEELYARQHRSAATEDPTHYCIRSQQWWGHRFSIAHLDQNLVTKGLSDAMNAYPDSFTRRYDWDWLIIQKMGEAERSVQPEGR